MSASPAAQALRFCASFGRRLLRGGWRWRQAPDWPAFAGPDWPDRIMGAAVTDRFHAKQGRSIGRWSLSDGGGRLSVYLKRHYVLPRWRGWLATLWPGGDWSDAMQESRHLEWARANGFPVPRAVASGETIGPWGRLQSFLAVEELAGMLPLHEAVPLAAGRLSAAEFARWKRGLVAEAARLVRGLHDRRRFHKDLYLCHFYSPEADTRLSPATWRGRVFLIDLHRLGFHPITAAWWRCKDLGQLLYSSEVPGVTARDRLRFARLYRGGRRGLFDCWLEGLARVRARNYRRHHAKRRGTGSG
jgi:heptose I phosphotransferase